MEAATPHPTDDRPEHPHRIPPRWAAWVILAAMLAGALLGRAADSEGLGAVLGGLVGVAVVAVAAWR
jgi:hypothetical protein